MGYKRDGKRARLNNRPKRRTKKLSPEKGKELAQFLDRRHLAKLESLKVSQETTDKEQGAN